MDINSPYNIIDLDGGRFNQFPIADLESALHWLAFFQDQFPFVTLQIEEVK